MSDIVILGIFVADNVCRADRLPKIGETLLGSSFSIGPGGKGSNQAVAAGRAGGRVAFITRVGADDFAALGHRVWAEAGVQPVAIEDRDSYTGVAFIVVENTSGNNAIIVAPGAAARLSPADIDAQAALISGAKVFLTQLEQPQDAARRGLEIARAAGVRTILNPAPATALDDAFLSLCDIVTPNESEAETLTGIAVATTDDAIRAAKALMARGAGAALITLGEKGVLYHDGQQTLHVAAHAPGPVVDTTGAGDAFNGGFVTALSEGADLLAAMRFGCALAGISVTRPGSSASMPTRAEIDAHLAQMA